MGSQLSSDHESDRTEHNLVIALRLDPDNPEYVFSHAELCRLQGRFQEALVKYEKVIILPEGGKVKRKDVARYYKAAILLKLGRLDEAYAFRDDMYDPFKSHNGKRMTAASMLALRCQRAYAGSQNEAQDRVSRLNRILQLIREDYQARIACEHVPEVQEQIEQQLEAETILVRADYGVDTEPPPWLVDGVTSTIMQDPVQTLTGYAYERATMQRAEELDGRGHHPATRVVNPHRPSQMVGNQNVRDACQDWIKKNPEYNIT